MEIAGVVERGSLLAPHMPAGTRVMGITAGGFADYALGHPRLMVPIPGDLTFDQAATLPVGLITGHDALVTQAGFAEGETVLLVGGTSAIGLVAIQLAKALGAATVIATTTREAKKAALLGAGADLAVDTSAEDLAEVVLAATDGRGADVTLDHVGGELFAALPAATAIGGRIVSIGRLAGAAAQVDLDTIALRRQRLIGTTLSVRTRAELGDAVAALAGRVLPALADGRITARLDSVYPAGTADAAAQRVRSNAATGKVVLSFADAHAGREPVPDPRANLFDAIRQIGYVVHDIEDAMEGFIASGVGPWFYLKGVRPAGFTYRGRASDTVVDVAVAGSGDLLIALITPVNDAPSMYNDFLDAGNEGVQHVGYWSEDYQDLYDRALAAGFTVGQEGRIGAQDGCFAYLSSERHPGTVIEISDLGGSKKFVSDLAKLAAAHWDGSNPIQEIDARLITDPAAQAQILDALG